ncbi:MAG: hypothetical protein ACJAQ1_000730 [Flavobacterium sp.]|jgi:hypothetical protein
MITSIFKKSTPINYSIIAIAVILMFFLSNFPFINAQNSPLDWVKLVLLFVEIIASFFLVNFIAKKNGLTKDNGYVLLLFFLSLLLFPKVWTNFNLVTANFFILLSLRKAISLQTLNIPKEKIFDASIWIFVASFFEFWSILFLVVIYISIIFHVSRDYRNWIIPIIAFFTVGILFLFYSLAIYYEAIPIYLQTTEKSFALNYFNENSENIAFSIFAVWFLFFVFPAIINLSVKPLILQDSFKIIIVSSFLGILVFALTGDKSNEVLLFTFFPLAILGTNFIEYAPNQLQKEFVLASLIIASFVSAFIQL